MTPQTLGTVPPLNAMNRRRCCGQSEISLRYHPITAGTPGTHICLRQGFMYVSFAIFWYAVSAEDDEVISQSRSLSTSNQTIALISG